MREAQTEEKRQRKAAEVVADRAAATAAITTTTTTTAAAPAEQPKAKAATVTPAPARVAPSSKSVQPLYKTVSKPLAADAPQVVTIYYGSKTGTAEGFANRLSNALSQATTAPVTVASLAEYDIDKLSAEKGIVIFITATYEHGSPPDNANWFHTTLLDAANDFRVKKTQLANVRYAVFGLGNSLYRDNFNRVAREIDVSIAALSGLRIVPTALGDENVANSKTGSLEGDFEAWLQEAVARIPAALQGSAVEAYETDGEADSEEEDEADDGMVDLEDLGNALVKGRAQRQAQDQDARVGKPRAMITPALRKALTKQGYKLIGSHSGVKLCRWTKSMLRGRGGCYKHTFYGIASHRCMETTPSLACANKCVFCWRHHTNPVGTEWRWQMDEPIEIVNGAMQNHYDMVRQFSGAPGVMPERMREAMEIRHCALSLVGEPIMYPKINEFLDLLHDRNISSFLVTNAQFPDAIANLRPCCQLYVSIDASNEQSLKQIDRPLFKDYWPRFLECLRELGRKGQRTVYRLTVVKAWNDDEIRGYADLVQLGEPDFIEVKGVTFCGTSKASSLTMDNVPFHEEVVGFVQTLVDMLPDYELVCEHEHSNSVLAVHKRLFVGGRWHTWIDYPRFIDLVRSGKPFSTVDYMAPTPEWAILGHGARGFDPVEVRHRRNKPTGSGC
ncbi:uncharacterized protein MONBRDRAFT_14102 [Monosiga brevicollis MX1]|uniref:tRNA 4-demethylwyosine synthase (AdoMet-dependent) n=1 Tax=Monosiga brevicollis TaxID=81824 RepID=A9UQE3_MONBE|nr:uncharacterized protein MONBRDRAFT_14102 [Monosiga brevicollis MX1]EDQ93030.1 predicted protein [Monosiga brevicollis MX1]|eukprot:XP_001742792.1 hypothetical protein [Monosiga brevicollis MX1]